MKNRSVAIRPRIAAAAVVLAVTAGGLAACSSADGAASSERISVVAGENFWGDVTRQIGGSAVAVTSIVSDPTTDPHEYETDARNAVAVAKADLVVVNGGGYDEFMQKLMDASPNNLRPVVDAHRVLKAGEEANPHLWYKPEFVNQVADAIRIQLAMLRPDRAGEFTANLAAFVAAEQAKVVGVIAQIEAKYAGTQIGYTERVPGYLVEQAGLVLGVPSSYAQSVEEGNDPRPGDQAAFETAIARNRIKVLLYNAQVASSNTQKLLELAKAHDVPVVAVTETMPPGAVDFQSWQASQAQQLLVALGG